MYAHLEEQVSEIAPELPQPLVSASIKVERIGFTRNASRTPYIVYTVRDRRCSTFIKRSRLRELEQILLKLKYSIEDRIKSVVSSRNFGLSVKFEDCHQYIPSAYLNRFFERYNKAAIERTEPQ